MAGVCDRGRLRANNEDAIAFDLERGYAVVADGMGGHRAGEVASRLAIETLTAELCDAGGYECHAGSSLAAQTRMVHDAILKTNQAIFEQSQTCADHRGMGTTLVLARVYGRKLVVAHVGDSRLYRLRAGRMRRLTRDHSFVEECVQRGEMTPREARESSFGNVITRALGLEPAVAVELNSFAWRDEDLYLLCSDGLSDLLSDRNIKQKLTVPEQQLDSIARALVAEANARGGSDNISVLLMRLGRDA